MPHISFNASAFSCTLKHAIRHRPTCSTGLLGNIPKPHTEASYRSLNAKDFCPEFALIRTAAQRCYPWARAAYEKFVNRIIRMTILWGIVQGSLSVRQSVRQCVRQELQCSAGRWILWCVVLRDLPTQMRDVSGPPNRRPRRGVTLSLIISPTF